MTPARLASTLIWLAIALPWLVLLPTTSALFAAASASLAVAAAVHGLGLTLARACGLRIGAALAMQWGIGVVIALGGVGVALQVFSRTVGVALTFAGISAHSGTLLVERRTRIASIAGRLREPENRYWIAPVLAVVALAVLHVLGTAGDPDARPFDDETHHLAQLRRLWDTGGLGDAIGFARESQLGGQIVVASLTGIAGDLHLWRWLDGGLGFVLVLTLVVASIKPRDASTTLWSLAIVVALSAVAFVAADPASCWIACGLALALYSGPTTDRAWIPFAIVAGALATLRHEMIPVAVAAVVASGSADRRIVLRRMLAVAGIALAVIAPYWIAATVARADVPETALRFLEVARITPARIAFFGVLVVVLGPLLARIAGPDARIAAYATAAGIAGIASQLSGTRPYATRFVWPIAIASFVAICLAQARSRLRLGALIGMLVIALLVVEGREARGRVRWSRRHAELAASIEYLRATPSRSRVREELLGRVPEGALVATWVARSHQLDPTRHRLVDLRTPRIARLRTAPWERGHGALARFVMALAPTYLLVEDDHEMLARVRDTPGGWWCELLADACNDDLDAGYRELARQGTTRLLERGP